MHNCKYFYMVNIWITNIYDGIRIEISRIANNDGCHKDLMDFVNFILDEPFLSVRHFFP